MKKFNNTLFFFSLIICCSLFGRNKIEKVLLAHKLYGENQYESALELYNKVENKGSGTWYNMGNCHYKMDDPLNALICWKKAEQYATWKEFKAIHHNIDQAYEKLGIIGITKKESFLRHARRYLSTFSLFGWQIIFLILWTLMLFTGASCIQKKRYYSMTMLALFVILSATSVFTKYTLINKPSGIVTKENLIVYAGPNDEFHDIGTVIQADHLTICQEEKEWLKIKYNDIQGWVSRNDVAVI